LGAYLHRGGAAIPDYQQTGNAAAPADGASRERWFLLSETPLLELRILPEEAYIGVKPGIGIFSLIQPLAANAKILGLLGHWQASGP
jgi:hypothetical protein